MVMMFHMQLLHYRGIANLPYVVHAYVLVTYDIDICHRHGIGIRIEMKIFGALVVFGVLLRMLADAQTYKPWQF